MLDNWSVIKVNRDDLKELKRLYEKAQPGEIFIFKEKEVLKEYAKYMIEHLENQFAAKEN
jgi:hypothetical protein